jgi:hypothetical protein
LTCFCDLPQNEHFRSASASLNFATRALLRGGADPVGAAPRRG